MTEENLALARAAARWRLGRFNEHDAILEEVKLRADFHEMLGAAQQAGRGDEFAQTWRHVSRQVEVNRLGSTIGRREMLAYLLPYAMSDPAYVRAHFAGKGTPLSEAAIREVVKSARDESALRRQRTIDEDVHTLRQDMAERGEGSRGRRLRVNLGGRDPKRIRPLAQDEGGRFGRLQGHRPEGLVGGLLKRKSLFLRQAGLTVPDVRTKTSRDEALEDLRERFGVEIITPEREAKLRARERARRGGILGRVVRAGTLTPFRTLGGAARALLVGSTDTLRRGHLARRLMADVDDATRAQLQDEIRRLDARNPFTIHHIRQAGAGATLRSLWHVLPKSRLLLVALLLAYGLYSVGWTGSFALSLQAIFVLVTSLANYALGMLNGFLALFVGTFNIGLNLGFGLLNSALSLVYDVIWRSIGQFVVGAHYERPYLGVGGLVVPQVSYLLSVLHVGVDEHGDKVYAMPQIIGVDANAVQTSGLFWFTKSYTPPHVGLMSKTCDELGPPGAGGPTFCRSFDWRQAPGTLHAWACTIFSTDATKPTWCQSPDEQRALAGASSP